METAASVLPALSMEVAAQKRASMVKFVQEIMDEGIDYGAVPGTDRPVLKQPGAEKLQTFFGLETDIRIVEKVEDWTGADHGGEPFFYYLFACHVKKNGQLITIGYGSCNSWEKKYRYRWIDKNDLPDGKIPAGAMTRRSAASVFDFQLQKAETTGPYGKPEEYWQEFREAIASGRARRVQRETKRGKQDAWEIESISVRVKNEDPAEIVNTVQKIGKKRALIDGVKTATGASEFFTQDLEDIEVGQTYDPSHVFGSPATASESVSVSAVTIQSSATAPQPPQDRPAAAPQPQPSAPTPAAATSAQEAAARKGGPLPEVAMPRATRGAQRAPAAAPLEPVGEEETPSPEKRSAALKNALKQALEVTPNGPGILDENILDEGTEEIVELEKGRDYKVSNPGIVHETDVNKAVEFDDGAPINSLATVGEAQIQELQAHGKANLIRNPVIIGFSKSRFGKGPRELTFEQYEEVLDFVQFGTVKKERIEQIINKAIGKGKTAEQVADWCYTNHQCQLKHFTPAQVVSLLEWIG